jgi:uncharacterized membrane protein YraQ (UPF0718 family)
MDIIIGIIIALIIGAAVFYIIKEKKKGKKCIGCPYANSCSKCNSEDFCNKKEKNQE